MTDGPTHTRPESVLDDPRGAPIGPTTPDVPRHGHDLTPQAPGERRPDDRDPVGGPAAPGAREFAEAAHTIEPPSVPDGTFVKVRPEEHPLPPACECTVYFQDYHRSSSKLGRFAKIVGIDARDGEYLLMLDNYECLSAPMRRVEWRKIAT